MLRRTSSHPFSITFLREWRRRSLSLVLVWFTFGMWTAFSDSFIQVELDGRMRNFRAVMADDARSLIGRSLARPGDGPGHPAQMATQDGSRLPGRALYDETGIPGQDEPIAYLTRRIHLELVPGASSEGLEARHPTAHFEKLIYAPSARVVHWPSPEEAWKSFKSLRLENEVLSARPILAIRKHSRVNPADALFSQQWSLLNTGQNGAEPGMDIRVTNVWNRFRGTGVVIGIVDDGVEISHPDLATNYRSDLSYDYLDNDRDPTPSKNGIHGTPVAGIAAARGNNFIGLAGVAFESPWAALRLIGPGEGDDQEAASMVHSNQWISIYNNSWGRSDSGMILGGLGPLLRQALEYGAREGRGGLGSIVVWAAGNGGLTLDNVNYDTYANNMHVIAVASVNDLGVRSSFSEPGACVAICAPGGDTGFRPQSIVTTDRLGEAGWNSGKDAADLRDGDYTRNYKGTSASAPMVSGAVALMLQANPRLGWRDVKEILIRSARQLDPANSDWIINGAGLRLSHFYGGGLLDVEAAVERGMTWTNLPPMSSFTNDWTPATPVSIPDNAASGVEQSFSFAEAGALFRVEHVTLTADIAHPARGDLAVRLTSPSGTISRLAERHSDPNADYPNHTFSSILCWGESATGTWKVRVVDLRTGNLGSIKSLRLALHGASPPPPPPSIQLVDARLESAGKFSFRVLAGQPGQYEIQASLDAIQWEKHSVTNAPSAEFTVMDANAGLAPYRFFRVLRLP